MSAIQRHDVAPRTRSQRATAPSLRPVPDLGRPVRQVPFMVVLALILGAGMVGLLVLNTTLQRQSFELRSKQNQVTALGYTQQALEHDLNRVSSPASLTAKATELGLRPNPAPAFLVLPDGRVVGEVRKADGSAFGSALIKSPAQLEAERQAAAAKKAAEEAKKAAEARQRAEAAQRQAAAQASAKPSGAATPKSSPTSGQGG